MFKKFLAPIGLAALSVLPAAPARASSAIDGLTLRQVYAMPEAELEQAFLSEWKEACGDFETSANAQGTDENGLSRSQSCAVQAYTGGASRGVNSRLWKTDATGGALSGSDWVYVRTLDAGLAKLRSEPAQVVYSGTVQGILPMKKKGQTYRLKGYTSTSTSRDMAEGFVRDRLMVITAISGKNVKAYSQVGYEDELLLARSTFVRFDRAEMQTLELVNEETGERTKKKVEVVYLTEVPKK